MGHRSTGMLWDCMYSLFIFNIGKSHFLRMPQGEALWQPIATVGIKPLVLSLVAHSGPGQARPALESGSQALTKKAAGWP